MKKILYITVNSKPENLSASRTVGRSFVEALMKKKSIFTLEELDLYSTHIPRLEYQYFQRRNCIIDDEAAGKLPDKEQKEVQKIKDLCDQFIAADIYVLAAPMWSLSFPAPLKEYLDCIVQEDLTIAFPQKDKKPVGLLDDKPRTFVYIQSSGAKIPFMVGPIMNKGLEYIEDIMKFIGIKHFEKLLVDGTGTNEEEKNAAITEAMEKMGKIIEKISM